MKKLLLLALLATMMVGCDKKHSDGTYEPCKYKVYVIDSCEYVGVCEGGQCDFLNDIEYVRKDSFINKACEWIKYNNENGGCLFDGWEEDFKKYLEE